MRCNKCNVDLGESVEICPLCGAPASDTPPVITEIKEADYPANPEKLPQRKERILPNKYVLRVISVLCLLFCFSGNNLLYSLFAPLLLCGGGVYLFICGLKEQGNLLHSAAAMLAEIGWEILLLVLHLIMHHNTNTTLFITIVTIALAVILYAVRPERFAEQMKATLRM